ncbi:hypothetical protein HYV49_00165 [Candidatus Pacearchaeota archaeon]|nr:hypothetical protein [Candidatus Pacearchaeota archaeon]
MEKSGLKAILVAVIIINIIFSFTLIRFQGISAFSIFSYRFFNFPSVIFLLLDLV